MGKAGLAASLEGRSSARPDPRVDGAASWPSGGQGRVHQGGSGGLKAACLLMAGAVTESASSGLTGLDLSPEAVFTGPVCVQVSLSRPVSAGDAPGQHVGLARAPAGLSVCEVFVRCVSGSLWVSALPPSQPDALGAPGVTPPHGEQWGLRALTPGGRSAASPPPRVGGSAVSLWFLHVISGRSSQGGSGLLHRRLACT